LPLLVTQLYGVEEFMRDGENGLGDRKNNRVYRRGDCSSGVRPAALTPHGAPQLANKSKNIARWNSGAAGANCSKV
jgi:hypothetical protein